ncbi:MAG: glycosyltransferase family 4 protein [Desulfobulbaceae bacterium]|nr:MAG: glycosyltransferase family 4 protein [Desulfobulbaceae bacterium]
MNTTRHYGREAVELGYRAIKVLVLAPSFPAINQPWIDTYLEQLLRQGFEPLIFTCNSSPGKYSEKVDRLNLRQHIVDIDLRGPAFVRAFVKSIVTCPWKCIESIAKSFRVTRLLAGKYSVSFLPTFLKTLRFGFSCPEFEQVDIIHSHDEVLAFEFLLCGLMLGKPLVYTFHGLQPKGVPPLADAKRRALYGEVSTVLVNTEFSKQQVQHIGCPPGKAHVLPQGLPLEDFPFVPRPAPGKNESVSLLTVGRYHADKGQRYALLALRRLRDRGVDAYWHFVGVGPDMGNLVAFAERYGVGQHSIFHSSLNLVEILNLYQRCDLFILPSLSSRIDNRHVETQGVVLQEAQASGCIPIATKVGGIPECLHDKEDAILVKDRSSRAIADAVCYLLYRPDEWACYQEKGRHNVERNFSADVIGRSMAKILTGVVQEKRSV